MTMEWWRYSFLRLQELSTCSSIPSKCFSMWLMKSFPLKFTDRLERSNADRYRQSNIVFDLKITRMCPTGSITMQWGLSSGKQKLTCSGVVCRLPRELGACANSVYQALFPPPLHNEASVHSNTRPTNETFDFLSLKTSILNEDRHWHVRTVRITARQWLIVKPACLWVFGQLNTVWVECCLPCLGIRYTRTSNLISMHIP